jgi:Asp/Glu/hydantoin racemase
MSSRPLIALVHAIPDSMPAAISAFERGWPEAEIINLVDDSLFKDLDAGTSSASAVIERFLALTRYALGKTTAGKKPQGLLFCCSAFGYAIEAVRKEFEGPILTPAEAALEHALEAGSRIGLVVSAEGAVRPLVEELSAIAGAHRPFELFPAIAHGAMPALRAGRFEEHDRIVADTIGTLPATDAIILGQFTMSRAAATIKPRKGERLYTTPSSAVVKLRSLLGEPVTKRASAS